MLFTKKTILSVAFGLLILRGAAQNQTNDPLDDMADGLEYVWRSSDLPNESPTLRTQREKKEAADVKFAKHNGQRIGCICMDGDRQFQTGIGACAGHSGVRFWLYRMYSGDTMAVPTRRHLQSNGETKTYKPRKKQFKLDDLTVNALVYSVAVLLGSGAVVLLKKHFWPKEDLEKETPPPPPTDDNKPTDDDAFFI